MKLLKLLNQYYDEGWLIKSHHPTLPLTIWNYSVKTTYERHWDYITIMCRGLITDDKGNVIARPFRKFWNWEENKHTPTPEWEMYSKQDGSLGILFYYEGEWRIASRGSFISDQAVKANEMLYSDPRWYNHLQDLCIRHTYLLEIIYPQNRIVVDYKGHEMLTMLGAVNIKDRSEKHLDQIIWSNKAWFTQGSGQTFEEIKNSIGPNQEGYVIKFSNGHRIKIKGEEYIRLHKILTNISTTSVWECLSSGVGVETILDNVPDEFFNKIKQYELKLKSQYKDIEDEMLLKEAFINRENGFQPFTNRKDYWEQIKDLKSYIQALLWHRYDNKSYDHIIWKLIKPQFEKL